MKNLLEFILIHLVNHPDSIVVDEERSEREAFYTIHADPEDVGRIIGKGGSIINAIRNIVKIRAIKEGVHARVNLASDETQPPAQE